MTTEQIAVSKRISNNGTVSFDFDHGDYHVRVRFRVNGDVRVGLQGPRVVLAQHQYRQGWTDMDLIPYHK